MATRRSRRQSALPISVFQHFRISAFAYGHASLWLRQLIQVRYRSLRVQLLPINPGRPHTRLAYQNQIVLRAL